jgi:hypothetical protein
MAPERDGVLSYAIRGQVGGRIASSWLCLRWVRLGRRIFGARSKGRKQKKDTKKTA